MMKLSHRLRAAFKQVEEEGYKCRVNLTDDNETLVLKLDDHLLLVLVVHNVGEEVEECFLRRTLEDGTVKVKYTAYDITFNDWPACTRDLNFPLSLYTRNKMILDYFSLNEYILA